MWTVWPSARCQRDSFYLIALPFEGIVHDEGHFCSFDQCLHISTYDIRWHISHQSSLHMALWIDKSDVWEAIDTKLPCPKIILKVPGKRRAYPGSLEGSSIPASMIFIYRYIYIYIHILCPNIFDQKSLKRVEDIVRIGGGNSETHHFLLKPGAA